LCCLFPSSNRFRPQISAPPVGCSVFSPSRVACFLLGCAAAVPAFSPRESLLRSEICAAGFVIRSPLTRGQVRRLESSPRRRFFFLDFSFLVKRRHCCVWRRRAPFFTQSPSQARQPSLDSSRSTRQRSPEGTLCKSRRPRFPWSASICPKENHGVRLRFHMRLS
jgi:hypothetical protein